MFEWVCREVRYPAGDDMVFVEQELQLRYALIHPNAEIPFYLRLHLYLHAPDAL
jgi:hypothetical protein